MPRDIIDVIYGFPGYEVDWKYLGGGGNPFEPLKPGEDPHRGYGYRASVCSRPLHVETIANQQAARALLKAAGKKIDLPFDGVVGLKVFLDPKTDSQRRIAERIAVKYDYSLDGEYLTASVTNRDDLSRVKACIEEYNSTIRDLDKKIKKAEREILGETAKAKFEALLSGKCVENLAGTERRRICSGVVFDLCPITDYYGDFSIGLHILFPDQRHPLGIKQQDNNWRDFSYKGLLLGLYPDWSMLNAGEDWARHGKKIGDGELGGISYIYGTVQHGFNIGPQFRGTVYIRDREQEHIEDVLDFLMFTHEVLGEEFSDALFEARNNTETKAAIHKKIERIIAETQTK